MKARLLATVAITAFVVAAAAMASHSPDWAQFRNGPAHTGFNASEHSLSPANVRRLRPAWTHRTSQPVWSSPAVVGTTVFIGSNDRRVYALRASDGRQLWSAPVGGRPAAPAVFRGMVYVFSDDARVTAFALGGERRWSTVVSSLQGGYPAAPTLAGSLLYVMAHGISAVDMYTGRIVWQRELESFGSPVTVVGPRVYLGAIDVSRDPPAPARMYALDRTIGSPVWSTPIAGRPVWTAPVSGNRVFLGSYTEVRGIKTFRLEAFDTADGHRHWRVPIGQSRVFTFTAPAVAGSRIVVPSPSGYLVAHDVTTGKRLWRTELPVASSAPAIANGVVYVGSGDGNLNAYALTTGKKLWSARLGQTAVNSSPTVVNGAVYVGSDDGNVVAFRRR
ncbi:MAG: PQQ-binding-like beta-propeller repeat protein [Actinomycetota bacterium]|nr:PQQ-binding-like beta-propeller repeat protein [Actinomycetota bacterium]